MIFFGVQVLTQAKLEVNREKKLNQQMIGQTVCIEQKHFQTL